MTATFQNLSISSFIYHSSLQSYMLWPLKATMINLQKIKRQYDIPEDNILSTVNSAISHQAYLLFSLAASCIKVLKAAVNILFKFMYFKS
jgi:hypothetical protein